MKFKILCLDENLYRVKETDVEFKTEDEFLSEYFLQIDEHKPFNKYKYVMVISLDEQMFFVDETPTGLNMYRRVSEPCAEYSEFLYYATRDDCVTYYRLYDKTRNATFIYSMKDK